ncbi:putative ABC transporter permease protein [Gordonia hirsuta DSM 44140 = NBRC 16056]|uniref:Putative ABC transporter permease protein n=1 Tax=Gordonia hirsuta DSM 44140 = NBRC 16056 TaxID=1121927 RepID=L7LEY2_9ACTN|nr:iron chelate uptake ABC transporter family permease subunit [Gordonia hirsuta]GAC58632.1 putative ABC transporter permease protein [Gordonia hirsuta DSM 44140 = NBRC 16056]
MSAAVDIHQQGPTPGARGAQKDPGQKNPGQGLARTNARRALGWLLLLAVLAGLVVASLLVGTTGIPLSTIWEAMVHFDPGQSIHHSIRDERLARTLLGVLVGMSLAVAGALIQAMTRNPLADPGILGVNAGAAFFVALAMGLFGLTGIWANIWFAFLGAIVATVVVYAIGSRGVTGATPIRLTLAGVAVGALLTGITTGLVLLEPATFEQMRFWSAGSIGGRGQQVPLAILPFIALGIVLAASVAGSLNAVALGDDLARALGADVVRTRVVGVVAVTLLCGAATAAAGPIGFVGLMIPHLCRWLVGPEQRWIFAYSLVAGPILLLGSDIVGRLLLRPTGLQVGIVTAFLGAPVLIAFVRRSKASGL